MKKAAKTIGGLIAAVSLIAIVYWLYNTVKKKIVKSKGFLFDTNPIEYLTNIFYKNGRGDLGYTQVTFFNTISESEPKYLTLQLLYTIYLSYQLNPDNQSRIHLLNPGLREEVIEHEKIHIELWNEVYKNMDCEYNNQKYEGSIDEIIELIINDNPYLVDAKSETELKDIIQLLVNMGTSNLLDIYPTDQMNAPYMGVEFEVNRRLQDKHPNQALYSTKDKPIKE